VAVQVATLDILTERAHFDPEIARAIGDAITMEVTHARTELATRQDVHDVRATIQELRITTQQDIQELHATIQELRIATQQDIQELRAETRQQIQELRVETQQEIQELRGEIGSIRRDIQEIRNHEIPAVRSELKAGLAELCSKLRAEIHASSTDLIRLMVSGFITMFLAILGSLYFLLGRLP
jgi:polyhydroxyalkanoate synthesis regulator phasin